MNIVAGVIWGIILDDPIDAWDIQSTGCDVRAKQDARVGVAELEERVRAFLLFLFAL